MTTKSVLVVLSSHGQLGSTGRKTGWYLVRTHLYLLSPDRAILITHSRNLPIHTTSSHRISNSPLLPRKVATLRWTLVQQRPSRMTSSVRSFYRPSPLSGRIRRSSRHSLAVRRSLTSSSTLGDTAVSLPCILHSNP